MKIRIYAYYGLLVGMISLLGSCEDVIEVEVPSEEPRIIIDALIRVDVSNPLTNVRIKVSETNSFFGTIPPAGIQQITITGLENGFNAILLEEEPGSGIYSKEVGTEAFIAEEMFLQIDFDNEYFVAFAEFVPAVPIDNIEQGDDFLFDEDDTELIVTYTDDPDRTDFYLFDFDFDNFLATEDTFYNGQEFSFSYFYEDDLEPGDEVDISIMGIDEPLYDYMNLLIEQSGEDFGPFETPAVTVRGNIINATTIDNINNFNNVNTSDNFGLGYFAIVEEYKETFIIE